MAVKYECPKCGRKFTEWGAEKLGFKCPHDQWCPKDATGEIELARAGVSEDRSGRRAVLKRSLKRRPVVPKIPEIDGDEALVPGVEEFEAEEAFEERGFKVLTTIEEGTAIAVDPVVVPEGSGVVVIDEIEETIPFGEEIPAAEEGPLDEAEGTAEDEWSS